MKNLFSILLLVGVIFNFSFGQTKGFKTHSDAKHGFSFEFPATWKITNDKDASENNFIGTCRPTTVDEKNAYEECFDGIIFYILYYQTTLTKTLEDEGYEKHGNAYYTTDRVRDSVKTENITGTNWKGIYHKNTCGISCKETGFHAAAGTCEFFYFSGGTTTVCITTTGRQLDENSKKQLLKTFKFN